MKIDLNDPRITAFALGELQGRDAVEIARAVHRDPRVRAAVEEVRETSCLLLDSLTEGGADVLTSDQRRIVRSAGGVSDVVKAGISRAGVPVWKKPLVAGVGIAAVLAMTLYIVTDRKGGGSSLPVSEGTRTVATQNDDNAGQLGHGDGGTVNRGIPKNGSQIAIDKQNVWLDVVADRSLDIPLSSGSSTWPSLQRYINEQHTLPPKKLVRIQEMVNHFDYQTPSMLSGQQLTADVEMCSTPWAPNTFLVAVHVMAKPGMEVNGAHAKLDVNAERVKRIRLLGTAMAQDVSPTPNHGASPQLTPELHGNYVIYEIEPMDDTAENTGPWVTLVLGGSARLPAPSSVSWIHASSDLRFASVVTAAGMMMSGYRSPGELDAGKLSSLIKIIEIQDATTLSVECRGGLKLIRKAQVLLQPGSE